MNEYEIEKLLRKAPAPAPPPGAWPRLQARLSTGGTPMKNGFQARERLALKRWLPTLAYAALIFGCLITVAVQTSQVSNLREKNQELQAAVTRLEEILPQSDAPDDSRFLADSASESANTDRRELARLRAEVAQLRKDTADLASLRADNEKMRLALASSKPGTEEDPFQHANEKALSIRCINNMKQIGLAMRIYAVDHEDRLPPDFLSIKNELSTPTILTCPADKGRTQVQSWDQYSGASLSYEFLLPSISQTEDPFQVMTRCLVHGHIGLLDGSVQMAGPHLKLVTVNGRLKVATQDTR